LKPPIFADSGILLVDKPSDWTSHDVVNLVKRRFNVDKVGHCGTLDPAATGLLVIVLGKATKLSQRLSGENKVYESTLQLGIETDSQDATGNITAEKEWKHITEENIINALNSFLGKQKQIPPMVSAKKVNGTRLYKLARSGKEVEREPADIEIYSIDISKISMPYIYFTVTCSKGTYIRTLCHDLGKKLDSAGTLYSLRRTKSGIFDVSNAVTIEKIKEWEQDNLRENLLWIHNLDLVNHLIANN